MNQIALLVSYNTEFQALSGGSSLHTRLLHLCPETVFSGYINPDIPDIAIIYTNAPEGCLPKVYAFVEDESPEEMFADGGNHRSCTGKPAGGDTL